MKTIITILACFLWVVPCGAATIWVDNNEPADFNSIQEAINSAKDYDTVKVQPGTYYEKINFQGKAITVTGTNPNDLDTIYATAIDGGGSGNVVTFNNGEDITSALVGITIQNGKIGIYCSYSNPLVANCVVRYNSESGIEGDSASPVVRSVLVEENRTYGIKKCDGTITNSTIRANTDVGLSHCSGFIIHSTISCNGINKNGYGLESCYGKLLNCIISGNRIDGISANSEEPFEVRNCVILGNGNSGILVNGVCNLTNNIIINNKLWGIEILENSECTLNYNNVWHNLFGDYKNVEPGTNDTSFNPLFAMPGYRDNDGYWVEGDYHLRSTAGRWTGSHWVFDDVNSPCIDAGDPNDDIGLEPNPNGGRINQGAYSGTSEASKSPSGIVKPFCKKYPAMDFNKDCRVDFEDFALFIRSWLDCNLDPQIVCW